MGTNELGWLNAAFTVLGGTGLPAHEQHHAFLVLMGHVRSNAEFAAARAQGQSVDQWASETAKLLRRYRDSYPALMSVIDSGAFCPSPDDGLQFGLECILNGIESITHGRKKPQ